MWYVFFRFCFWAFGKLVTEKVDKEKEALVEQVLSILHRIKQEKHGDIFYWFDADSDAFLAQGKDEDEIRNHLLSRFNGHIFLIDNERAMAGPKLATMPISELTKVPDMVKA